ncbi:unnamed protein product [Lactuca virosa]|uniref:Coatomer subunit delta n=1 Tax=Lactuca virosa TaxID=75947 RepID=A0AAU9P8Z9_9ASTR|nr:unnamed protein product [Lactuca virosa]
MSKIRIEGLLTAFPKLIGSGKKHTYVETENVRYVYHPMEGIYLLLVTNKQSNILKDLDTLRLLSKVIERGKLEKGGYSSLQSMSSTGSMGSIGRMDNSFSNDMGISSGNTFGGGSGFGLTSDVDSFSSRPTASVAAPAKGMGMKFGKSQRTNQFLESLKAEGDTWNVLTHRVGSMCMLSLIYSEILKMLRMWGLVNFDVEISSPNDSYGSPRGYLKQRSTESDHQHIMTTESLLLKVASVFFVEIFTCRFIY